MKRAIAKITISAMSAKKPIHPRDAVPAVEAPAVAPDAWSTGSRSGIAEGIGSAEIAVDACFTGLVEPSQPDPSQKHSHVGSMACGYHPGDFCVLVSLATDGFGASRDRGVA